MDVVSLWSIEEKLEIKVDSAANLNVGKDASVSRGQRSSQLCRWREIMSHCVTIQIMVIAGVYHGDESLCVDGQTRAMHLDPGVCCLSREGGRRR